MCVWRAYKALFCCLFHFQDLSVKPLASSTSVHVGLHQSTSYRFSPFVSSCIRYICSQGFSFWRGCFPLSPNWSAPSAREAVGFHGKTIFGKNHMPIKLISPKDVVPGTKVKILSILNGSSGSFSWINISQFVACLWLVYRVLKCLGFFFIVLFYFLLARAERISHLFILP